MTILWIDATAGAAGDMLCAALLDAGGDLHRLRVDLEALGVAGFTLALRPVTRRAMAGLHFDVQLDEEDHDHGHDHDHEHGHDHGTRSWATIRAMIEGAALPARAKARALQVFGRLAQAEGRVHGVAPDQVSFHEVGAIDSIVDIVGCCLLLEQLDVSEIVATALPLGSGEIRAAHGRLSVPAPATLELLRGWPTVQDGRVGELLTPTGAALITTLAKPGPMPSMTPRATGVGAGTRDPAWSNTVRVVLGEAASPSSPTAVLQIEAQVDDMTGELLPALIDALLAAGALDAWAAPVYMKKGRAGLLLSAIAEPERADAVSDAMLRHSSSFGVRRFPAERTVLERRHVQVDTPYGLVRVKVGSQGGVVLHASPEHADCAARAEASGVPLAEVYAAAIAAYRGSQGTLSQ